MSERYYIHHDGLRQVHVPIGEDGKVSIALDSLDELLSMAGFRYVGDEHDAELGKAIQGVIADAATRLEGPK